MAKPLWHTLSQTYHRERSLVRSCCSATTTSTAADEIHGAVVTGKYMAENDTTPTGSTAAPIKPTALQSLEMRGPPGKNRQCLRHRERQPVFSLQFPFAFLLLINDGQQCFPKEFHHTVQLYEATFGIFNTSLSPARTRRRSCMSRRLHVASNAQRRALRGNGLRFASACRTNLLNGLSQVSFINPTISGAHGATPNVGDRVEGLSW